MSETRIDRSAVSLTPEERLYVLTWLLATIELAGSARREDVTAAFASARAHTARQS